MLYLARTRYITQDENSDAPRGRPRTVVEETRALKRDFLKSAAQMSDNEDDSEGSDNFLTIRSKTAEEKDKEAEGQ